MYDFMETGRGHVKCEDLEGAVAHEMVGVYVVIGPNVEGMDPLAGVELYAVFLYKLIMFSVHSVICWLYNT